MIPSFVMPALATIHEVRAELSQLPPGMGRRSVLVLESDDVLREAILNALGVVVPVVGVATGREALREMDRGCVSSVVMSLQPDDVDGEQLLKLIRERMQAAKVVVVSNSGDYELVRRVTDMGIGDFLEKPFTIDDLYHAVENSQRGNSLPLDLQILSARQHEKSRTRRMSLLACA